MFLGVFVCLSVFAINPEVINRSEIFFNFSCGWGPFKGRGD